MWAVSGVGSVQCNTIRETPSGRGRNLKENVHVFALTTVEFSVTIPVPYSYITQASPPA